MLKTDVIQKALVINNGKILALKRSDGDVRRPLDWDLPGGRLDSGESLEEGTLREIAEETGLNLSSPKLIYSKTEKREWKDSSCSAVFLLYSLKTDTTDIILSHEHIEHSWMTIAQALETFEYRLHKEFFAYILDNKVEL